MSDLQRKLKQLTKLLSSMLSRKHSFTDDDDDDDHGFKMMTIYASSGHVSKTNSRVTIEYCSNINFQQLIFIRLMIRCRNPVLSSFMTYHRVFVTRVA
jgi:hypothetical protein